MFILWCRVRSLSGLALTSRSGRRKWYSSRVVRSVELVSGFAKHPNPAINPDAAAPRRLS
ncbi:MAG: hypothetical protein FWD67_12425 [Betaproteobacteria bacterium]|nr:hypothetical protein [Betaproteobacteria bacterium]